MPVLGPEMAKRCIVEDAGRERIPIIPAQGAASLRQVAALVGTPYALAKPCAVTPPRGDPARAHGASTRPRLRSSNSERHLARQLHPEVLTEKGGDMGEPIYLITGATGATGAAAARELRKHGRRGGAASSTRRTTEQRRFVLGVETILRDLGDLPQLRHGRRGGRILRLPDLPEGLTDAAAFTAWSRSRRASGQSAQPDAGCRRAAKPAEPRDARPLGKRASVRLVGRSDDPHSTDVLRRVASLPDAGVAGEERRHSFPARARSPRAHRGRGPGSLHRGGGC